MAAQGACAWACALGVGYAVIAPVPATAGGQEVAVECRFSSGLTAIYMFSRGEARVRRADLLQPREGRVKVTSEEYRFIFLERDSAYRIELIIDRATGNGRRVFGTRENMERTRQGRGQSSGLVYEAGHCRAQGSDLR